MPPRRYRPFSSVTIVRTTPLSAFVTVMVTPGRMPPCASVTIQVTTAFETCAEAGKAKPTSNARGSTPSRAPRRDERLNVASITRASFQGDVDLGSAHYTAKRDLWTDRLTAKVRSYFPCPGLFPSPTPFGCLLS